MPTSLKVNRVRLKALLLAAAAPALLGATGAAPVAVPEPAAPVPPSQVIGTVGTESITAADVMKTDSAAFAKDQEEYDLALRQLDVRHREAQHELLRHELEALLDRRALELEAAARGATPGAVLADLKVPEVTATEAREFYESRRELTDQTFEQLESEIDQRLSGEHAEEATRRFYDELRAKHQVAELLPPYRAAVAAQGPSRGGATAAVTIVEFGDFQCPYCRAVEPTLRAILEKHPAEVRLVYRNLPLPSLHALALVAARAGVCAGQQGRFWEMHDAMFADQRALSQPRLERTAKALGLKLIPFEACLSDPRTAEAVSRDTAAAAELGIARTPYFFINGRPLHGNALAEKFEAIIADELQRARTAQTRAAAR